MKILIGTTNPSKVKQFEELLSGYDVEFCTLKDLGIESEPEETGRTVEENAVMKARYYGKFHDPVICNDSGLYFANLPLEDERQPGLNIRTPVGHDRLDDDEMIAYYSKLIGTLGGKVSAFYLNGVAVCRHGKIYSYMENSEVKKTDAFYMIDKVSEKRHPGWPLDSISVDRDTLRYFVDDENGEEDTTKESVIEEEYRKGLISFLKEVLGLKD